MAWMLAASMARRLISLPEAAGTPEGGKVLGRAARRWTQCSRLVRMTQSRLPVSSLLKCTGVLCRCRRRKKHRESFLPPCCSYARRRREPSWGSGRPRGHTRDIDNKAPMQKSASGKCPRAHVRGAYEYEKATSPDCLAAPSRKGSSPTATCAPDRRVGSRPSPGPRRGVVAAAMARTPA